jgi:hypothetical protein
MKVRNNHSQCVRNVLRNLNLIWSPRLHRQETNQDFDALQTKYTSVERCQASANRKTPTNRGFQKSSKKLFFTIERPDFLICKQAQLLSVCVCARQLSIPWTKLGLRNYWSKINRARQINFIAVRGVTYVLRAGRTRELEISLCIVTYIFRTFGNSGGVT